ncbi:AAA family ATPase (plasmid) [Sulfurimonas aquatica]|uniref:AAA family ATPase n=1 Tax=Sulfurimonas aquatica TaxID=2672570 RepID=A0A975B2X1_9BACT|nr:ATP-binding protein [Sulfurimonas aquatica]QSZ43180.1 AAA family ATPase [Sulfurimonas aquatica]
MDKSEIIEILNEWNYWNKELPQTQARTIYDSRISTLLNYNEVLVIKGIRRSGKSTLMLNSIKNLLANGVDIKNILFVNLEDPRFINKLSPELLQEIKDVYLEYLDPDEKPYIFLDEIQNIPNWEKWVNKEYELKLSNITISGSNSSMLSSEIASSLSGRYLQIDVYPLSFGEYLQFKSIEVKNKLDFVEKKIELNREFEAYLKYGAFPKVLDYETTDKRDLLITYKDSILLKDIVARYNLKEFKTLEEIAAFLLANSGISQSINKLKNNFHISYDMANAYLEYLIKAYMLFEIPKFDYSLKKQNANDKKYYSVDLGLSNIMRVPNLQTRGDDLETIVFLELLRRGYKVYYYKTSNGLECDFIVEEENAITQLIQVTSSLKDEKTKKRELRVFSKTIEDLQLKNIELFVIHEDNTLNVIYDDLNIKTVNIKEWLL